MAPETSQYDVVIIGAGIAGCAAAKAFADQGRHVLVLERHLSEPDRIVGELLQPGDVAALAKLGLIDCIQDIDAIPVTGYHMFWKGQEEVSFWFCASPGEPPDDKPAGRSFHHGRFVSRLRQKISEQENITLLQGNVVELIRDENSAAIAGVVCGDEQSTKYFGDLILLTDGASSNFRSQVLPYKPMAQSRFWGLELIDADLPFYSYAYGIIGSGPPMLIYQISKHETRMLIDILDDTYASLGSNSEAVKTHILENVLPILPERLQPSVMSAIHSGRLRSVPNRWVASSQNKEPGLVVLGDALNMRHPLTGGGMTVAFKDAVLVAELLQPAEVPSLSNHSKVLEKMRDFHWRRKRYASSINILAQALYLLFVAEDDGLEIMQKGFVKYIKKGEKNFAEPVGLMGGLVESPLKLVYHFVCIALYSIGLHLYEAGPLAFPSALFRACVVFLSAVKIILPSILDELKG